ncbi:MAG: hypothetical protein WBQ60_04275 [Asticcacaulis sp.]
MEQTDLTQRLRALATRLLDTYEAMDLPETFAETDRAAKALISIGKAIALTGGLSGDEASKPQPLSAPVPPVVSPSRNTSSSAAAYAVIERQAKALIKANRALKNGPLSEEEMNQLLRSSRPAT